MNSNTNAMWIKLRHITRQLHLEWPMMHQKSVEFCEFTHINTHTVIFTWMNMDTNTNEHGHEHEWTWARTRMNMDTNTNEHGHEHEWTWTRTRMNMDTNTNEQNTNEHAHNTMNMHTNTNEHELSWTRINSLIEPSFCLLSFLSRFTGAFWWLYRISKNNHCKLLGDFGLYQIAFNDLRRVSI